MRILRLLFILLLVSAVSVFVLLAVYHDPEQWLITNVENIVDQPLTLILIITAITIVFALTGLPVLYMSVALGYAFGFWKGLGLAWIINLVAVMTTFISVRYLFSDYFRKLAERKKIIERLNKGLDNYGPWYVAIARSIYIIPTNIINYGFALTSIKGRAFLAGTAIGLIPESLINVTAGALLKNELQGIVSGDISLVRIVVITGSLLLTLFLFLIIRKLRRKDEDSAA